MQGYVGQSQWFCKNLSMTNLRPSLVSPILMYNLAPRPSLKTLFLVNPCMVPRLPCPPNVNLAEDVGGSC